MNRTPRPPKETDAMTHRPSRFDDPDHDPLAESTDPAVRRYWHAGPDAAAFDVEAAEDLDPVLYAIRRARYSIAWPNVGESLTGLSLLDALAELDAHAVDPRWQSDEAAALLADLAPGDRITEPGLTITRRS